MAIILNKEKRGIFSSLGKIGPGESDHVPDEEVEALADKFHIKVLDTGGSQAKAEAKANAAPKKKAPAKKAAPKPAVTPEGDDDDEDWA
jgi:hypothetical protein